MTVLCGGGPSDSRPGFNGGVYLGAQGIGLLLKAFVPEPVAEAIAAIVSADALDLTTFCKEDPPPLPTPTAADYVALLNPSDFVEYDRVRKLFIQWWEHIYWYQACECTTVATPPLGPVPSPGPGGQNTGLPSGGNAYCYETTAPYLTQGVTSGVSRLDLTNVFLPQTNDRLSVSVDLGTGPISVSAVRIPAGVTAIFCSTQNAGASSPPGSNVHNGTLHFWSSTGTDLGGLQMLSSQSALITTRAQGEPLPTGATYFGVAVSNQFDFSITGKQLSWSVDIRFICGGSTLESPCCPPDPQLELKIDQMFQLLVNLSRAAPLQVATGWTDGARHTGLEKAGSFLIASNTIGVRFEFTTIPPGLQVSPGAPNFYWDLGFYTPFALGSPLRGARLVFNPESFHLPDFTDQIGYTLVAGAVANAIELVPTTR